MFCYVFTSVKCCYISYNGHIGISAIEKRFISFFGVLKNIIIFLYEIKEKLDYYSCIFCLRDALPVVYWLPTFRVGAPKDVGDISITIHKIP